MIPQKMITETFELLEEALRLRDRVDDTVIRRRVEDWTTNYLRAAAPSAGTQPGVITLPGHNDEPPADYLDAPPEHDPVGEAAIADGPEANYEEAFQRMALATRVFVAALTEVTRTEDPTGTEQRGTYRHAPDFQIGEGDCEACGIHMPGGEKESKRIKHYDAHPLCPRDHRQVHRDVERGISVDRSIATIRTYKWRGPVITKQAST
jgi:hypothetical protein